MSTSNAIERAASAIRDAQVADTKGRFRAFAVTDKDRTLARAVLDAIDFDALVAERDRLREGVERWTAESCGPLTAHRQGHNPLGQAMGFCEYDEHSWPCPTVVMLEWNTETLDGEVPQEDAGS